MNRDELAASRTDYDRYQLLEADAPADPLELFDAWMSDALAASEAGEVQEPTAMTVATLRQTEAGLRPAARVVLLKDFEGEGFTFYTNYESAKGDELAADPVAAATFWWPALFRQVRITGTTERVARATSKAYFAVRPRGSQLGALASAQSRPVASADALAEAYARVEAEQEGREVACPDYWGGYRLIPEEIEFWQGRPSRMHDRLHYRREGGDWVRTRLSP